ncbi:hypothetical protein PV326_006352 [Microctonus aethiopoides]|nr:hypothetical protein PV326_006352 [Microctonus aethiopoides]
MASDQIDDNNFKTINNTKKTTETRDTDLYSNINDELLENIECVSYSEFNFSTLACYICNGYYGPCFEEPVCATCHAFLFPDDVRPVPIDSEETDDEDSGNDEPNEFFYYNGDRNINPVQRQRPAIQQDNVDDQAIVAGYDQQHDQQQHQLEPEEVSVNAAESSEPIEKPLADEENSPNNEQFRRCLYRCTGYCKGAGEPSRRQNLDDRIKILSNYKPIDHESINESGLVERLPPEVLLAVFSYLDDLSLWSVANVCRRWHGLLLTHVPQQQWQQYVTSRWPLYRAIGHVENWYKVYDRLASSTSCRICLSQKYLRAKSVRVEENSWRRNRLKIELKGLKIDPPEGIEATPLDAMCCHWQATITGPIGSPYEGGLFYLYLQVPYTYPMCPPVVRFLTKILHPNVSRHGDVGIDSIHHNWSLALTISKVLISVQSLLTDPYCQVCMEPEIGQMYTNDRERFEEVARAWTWKYAMHDVGGNGDDDGDGSGGGGGGGGGIAKGNQGGSCHNYALPSSTVLFCRTAYLWTIKRFDVQLCYTVDAAAIQVTLRLGDTFPVSPSRD